MVTHRVVVETAEASAEELYRFFAEPTDRMYRLSWPGTHLQFHRLTGFDSDSSPLGDLVYFDEWVGSRRLRFRARVVRADPGERLVWQMVRGRLSLPGWLDIRFRDAGGGVTVEHVLRAGFDGRIAALTDRPLRLYLSDRFLDELTDHAREEFPRIAALM